MRLAPLCALAFTLGVASLPAVAADGADPLSKAIAAITGKEPAATAPAAKTAVIPSVARPPPSARCSPTDHQARCAARGKNCAAACCARTGG